MKSKILFSILILLTSLTLASSPKVITTITPEAEPTTLDQIQRFYEISEKSLELGTNITINQPTAFQVTINNNIHYITASNLTKNSIDLTFLGKNSQHIRQTIQTQDYIIFKIEDLNLQLTLLETNPTNATIQLKLYELQVPLNATYLELFDIQVRLPEHTIYSSNDLTAITEFTNFGEGASHVRLFYKITNSAGQELYTSIDEKIVETDEVVIKKFSNLNIPYGRYTIQTIIYYGDNQQAESQDYFTLTTIPKTTLLTQPLIFIAIILALFVTVIYFKKKKK